MFSVPGHMGLVRRLWKHSLAAGCFGKEIARTRRRNVESMFLCALLHDVGKPIVLDSLCTLGRETGQKFAEATLLAAMDEFHAEVGSLLSEEWGLPEQVTEAIRCHHCYDLAESFCDAAMMVNLADRFAHAVFPITAAAGAEIDEEGVRAAPVVAALNLYVDGRE